MGLKQNQIDWLKSYKHEFNDNDWQTILDDLSNLEWTEDVDSLLHFLVDEVGLNIYRNVNSLPEALFFDCKSVKNIWIPTDSSIIEIPVQFASSCSMEQIDIPKNIGLINDLAFDSCKNLRTLTLHDGLHSINRGAFKNCKLTEVTIPTTCTYIGRTAFANNPLTEVTILAKNADIEDTAFKDCNSIKKVKANELVIKLNEDLFTALNKDVEFEII